MDRRYIKSFAAEKGQSLGDVAQELNISQAWLSQIISGEPTSLEIAKRIEEWSNGQIPASRVLGLN